MFRHGGGWVARWPSGRERRAAGARQGLVGTVLRAKGATVAVERQTRAHAVPRQEVRVPGGPGLTRAEERALRRSTPLTAVQFKNLRRLAEQGISPLRHI